MESVEAYPLQWPAHVQRTPDAERKRASFGRMGRTEGRSWSTKNRLTIAQARDRLLDELDRLGAELPVISSGLRVRGDGFPVSKQRQPDDPGVAVYFLLDGEQHCMPCDRWDRIEDNIAAVAKHVEALRGIDRWGVGSVKAAFAGFKALPAPEGAMVKPRRWWEVLNLRPNASATDIRRQHRALAVTAHPDKGGSEAMMAEINAAREEGLRAVLG